MRLVCGGDMLLYLVVLFCFCVPGVLCDCSAGCLAAVIGAPLNASTLSKYLDPLPIPPTLHAYRLHGRDDGKLGNDWSWDKYGKQPKLKPKPLKSPLVIAMREFTQQVLPSDFKQGPYDGETLVWGYSASYPGPTIEALRGISVDVEFPNDLPWDSCLQARLPRDVTIMSGDFMAQHCNHSEPLPGPPFTTVHLHGGEQDSASDGHPLAWYTPGYKQLGPGFVDRIYHFPNHQAGTTMWYHDHGIGVTRLNVFAGLAGFYILRDPSQEPDNLPKGDFEIPLALQDRAFDVNGQLLFPQRGVGHPFWFPGFVGNVIVVNGKAWPYLSVFPRRYRFRMLDAANGRFFNLTLEDERAKWYIIGSDGGLMDHAVPITALLIGPSERYDMIIDFSLVPVGTRFLLRNSAPIPFANGAPPIAGLTDQVLEFRVVACPPSLGRDKSLDPAEYVEGGLQLRKTPIQRITQLVSLPPPYSPPDCSSAQTGTDAFPPSSSCRPRDGDVPCSSNSDGDSSAKCSHLFQFPDNLPDPSSVPFTAARHFTLSANFATAPVGLFLNNQEFFSPITERIIPGSVELWEFINLGDAHPIHIHLIQFQIYNRQPFNVTAYTELLSSLAAPPTYGPPFPLNTLDPRTPGGNPDVTPFLTGPPVPPAAYESGWKDVAINPFGFVTRYAVRFAPVDVPLEVTQQLGAVNLFPFSPFLPFNSIDPLTGHRLGLSYVWHCHILEHEDNMMMRPWRFEAPASEKTHTY